MDVITEKKVVPKLRFGEFKDDWNSSKIEDLFDFKNGLNKEKEFFGKGTPIINFKDVYKLTSIRKKDIIGLVELTNSELSRFSAIEGDVFFTRTSETIHDIGMSATLVEPIENCVFSGFVLRARPKTKSLSKYFTAHLFSIESVRKEITTKSSMTTRALTSGTLLNKVYFHFPSLSEQQKIASFLSAVDTKLQQLTKKAALLEAYKKGLLQKIFSQALRFKDEFGNNYPDWEEKKLGDIGETFNGLTGKTKEDFGRGKPFIQYMQIFNSAKIDKSKFGYVDIKEGEKQKTVQYGDIFFTTSSETPIEIGYSSVLTEEIEGLYLNSFCFGYRPNSLNELYPDFASYLFRSESLRKQIVKLAQGSTRYNMSKVQLMKVLIQLPSLDEQQKIANFLSSLDSKIELVSTQIENTKAFKKGLLQQMFV